LASRHHHGVDLDADQLVHRLVTVVREIQTGEVVGLAGDELAAELGDDIHPRALAHAVRILGKVVGAMDQWTVLAEEKPVAAGRRASHAAGFGTSWPTPTPYRGLIEVRGGGRCRNGWRAVRQFESGAKQCSRHPDGNSPHRRPSRH